MSKDSEHCVKCGQPATTWWPQVDKQWCDKHTPKGA